MGRSPEASMETESRAWKLEKVNREIDELQEKKRMLARNMKPDSVPELAAELEEIERQLMSLRIEQEFLKGETE